MRSEKIRALVSSALLALALFTGLHLGFENLARFVERTRRAYLFGDELWLETFVPKPPEHRADLLCIGPSEAREALLPEVLERELPTVTARQASLSMGTMEDLNLFLLYREEHHGEEALPRHLVVGITPRFVANIRIATPFLDSIEDYAPRHDVERTSPPQLVERSWARGVEASLRFQLDQSRRYQNALRVLAHELLGHLPIHVPGRDRLLRKIGYSRYRGLEPVSLEAVEAFVREAGTYWELTRAWDPGEDAEMIHRDFTALLAFVERHAMALFVVNLPEHPAVRASFDPERYEPYLRIVREALGETPFLDLREHLSADEFYDSCHPTHAGAVRTTTAVAAFLRQHEEPKQELR